MKKKYERQVYNDELHIEAYRFEGIVQPFPNVPLCRFVEQAGAILLRLAAGVRQNKPDGGHDASWGERSKSGLIPCLA